MRMITSTPLRMLFRTWYSFMLQKRLAKEVGILWIGMSLTKSSVTTAPECSTLAKGASNKGTIIFLWGHLVDLSSLFSNSIQVYNRQIFKSYTISHIRIIRLIGAVITSPLEVYLNVWLIMRICRGRQITIGGPFILLLQPFVATRILGFSFFTRWWWRFLLGTTIARNSQIFNSSRNKLTKRA